MSRLEQSIHAVRRVHSELGTAEFARVAGVPYTTLRDCEQRDFISPSVETLIKLAAAAEAYELAHAAADSSQ